MSHLNAKVLGEGSQKVIVLHDWFGSHENYAWTFPLWNTKAWTYHFVDLKGHGLSKDLEGQYNLQEAVSDLEQYIKKHSLSDAPLVCHSMTALLGYQLAMRHPLKGLFLTTPVPPGGAPMEQEVKQMIQAAMPTIDGRTELINFIYGSRLSSGYVTYKAEKFYRSVKTEAALGYLEMYSQIRDSSEINLKCPVHIFVGEKDFPPFTKDILEQAIQSSGTIDWTVHEQVGHSPMEEAPPFFVASVEAFLKSLEK